MKLDRAIRGARKRPKGHLLEVVGVALDDVDHAVGGVDDGAPPLI
jgi:hypothetical protein